MRIVLLTALLVTTPLTAGSAQVSPVVRWPDATPPSHAGSTAALQVADTGVASDGDMIAAGLLGGGLGLLGGGLLGTLAWSGCAGEECRLEGAAIGGLIGAAVGLPLGVHLADGRRGRFDLALLGAAGAGLAGITAVGLMSPDGAPTGIAVALTVALQTGAAVAIERAPGGRPDGRPW